MDQVTDEDKILNFDFHYAACLLALEDFADSLSDLYISIWLMTSGNDAETDKFYQSTYHGLIELLSEQAEHFEITDEFKQQYETQNNAQAD